MWLQEAEQQSASLAGPLDWLDRTGNSDAVEIKTKYFFIKFMNCVSELKEILHKLHLNEQKHQSKPRSVLKSLILCAVQIYNTHLQDLWLKKKPIDHGPIS